MEQIEKFTEEFFNNLKCEVSWVDGILRVENVPRSFEDLAGKSGPYRLSFVSGIKNSEFVGKGSPMFVAMMKFLEGAGKATILRIDFDVAPKGVPPAYGVSADADKGVNPEAEIRKRLSLRNCELKSLTKGYRNSFFSRFSFVTSFNYLNEVERVLSEVYVHEGAVVDGDLNGYSVVDVARNSVPSKVGTDVPSSSGARNSVPSKVGINVPSSSGNDLKVDGEAVKRDYVIAKARAVELAEVKQTEVSDVLKEKVEAEVARIGEHYDMQLKELGGDLNGKLDKIREVEIELRSLAPAGADKVGKDSEVLKLRLERLRKGLVKAGDDEVVKRVLREREFTIQDARQKFSLNVDRKLVNTTVIYYPVYSFKLHLKGASSEKLIDMTYDPLTKSLNRLECEGCGANVLNISLCAGGHVSCGECLDACGECGERFCKRCLKRSCNVCGRRLCRGCVKMCLRCGCVVCATHMRRDCVTGEERCVNCLRACLRCQGLSDEKYFGEAADGAKVCGKCLGAEKRGEVLGRVFIR
jgi:hypothetical protein